MLGTITSVVAVELSVSAWCYYFCVAAFAAWCYYFCCCCCFLMLLLLLLLLLLLFLLLPLLLILLLLLLLGAINSVIASVAADFVAAVAAWCYHFCC